MAEFQHIVPQVYLRKFGFKKRFANGGEKDFVSVKNLHKYGKWEDREIKKLLGDNEFYTLSIYEDISAYIIEKNLNGTIEGRYNRIISFLDDNSKIPKGIHLDIAETASNFLCRSVRVYNWIKGWLERENFQEFYDLIIHGLTENKEHSEKVLEEINEMPEKDQVLRLMVFFMRKVKAAFVNAKLVIFDQTDAPQIFTSDNPVKVMNVGFGEMQKKEMETFFPLSNGYLAYFYWDEELSSLGGFVDNLKSRTIVGINRKVYDHFHKKVLTEHAQEYIVAPFSKEKLGR